MAVRQQADALKDQGLSVFMVLMFISYAAVFMLGMMMAWSCLRTKSGAIRDVLVVGQVADHGGNTRTRSAALPSRTRTDLVDAATLAACYRDTHEVKSGSNAVSIFTTCFDCLHHATWKKNDQPTFSNFPELRFLRKSWDKLQERGTQSTPSAQAAYDAFAGRPPTRGVSSGTVPTEEPIAVAKAAARPKRTARTTAALTVAAAAAAASTAAAAEEETLTATVTVTRPRPKRAPRTAAAPVDEVTAAAAGTPVHDYYEDEDWWDEVTPTSLEVPPAERRTAATRRTTRSSTTDADL